MYECEELYACIRMSRSMGKGRAKELTHINKYVSLCWGVCGCWGGYVCVWCMSVHASVMCVSACMHDCGYVGMNLH